MPKITCFQPWVGVPATGPILPIRKAAEYVGYSPSGYYAGVVRGFLPPVLKIGQGVSGRGGVPRPWLDAVIAHRAAGGSAEA